jgi:hypothetical protein
MRELRERAEPALRIFCLILAAVVIYELAGMIARWNPFRGVKVPDLPALSATTNAPAGGGKGTNALAAAKGAGTNGAPQSASTNASSLAKAATNAPAAGGAGSVTNTIAIAGTNVATNVITAAVTNLATKVVWQAAATNSLVTNPVAMSAADTNLMVTNATAQVALSTNGGTNVALSVTGVATNHATNLAMSASSRDTNPAAGSKPKRKKSGGGPMADMGAGPGPAGPGVVELPAAVKTRIGRVTDSEILGPVIRPQPMALLGIAGTVAFLRSDSGQTGLVKLGDSLDDLKLLQIGINRVLIEQNGQKKELTIFSGYGGESLLQTDTTNENKHL